MPFLDKQFEALSEETTNIAHCGLVGLSESENTKQLKVCTPWADWHGDDPNIGMPYPDFVSYVLEFTTTHHSADKHSFTKKFYKMAALEKAFLMVFHHVEKHPYPDLAAFLTELQRSYNSLSEEQKIAIALSGDDLLDALSLPEDERDLNSYDWEDNITIEDFTKHGRPGMRAMAYCEHNIVDKRHFWANVCARPACIHRRAMPRPPPPCKPRPRSRVTTTQDDSSEKCNVAEALRKFPGIVGWLPPPSQCPALPRRANPGPGAA